MGTKLVDRELWEITKRWRGRDPDIDKLLAHVDWQEREITEQRREAARLRMTPECPPNAGVLGWGAALMRAHARAATVSASGRWTVTKSSKPYPQSITDDASAVLVATCYTEPSHPPVIADHIANADPVFVLAVVDLLDVVAGQMADSPIEFARDPVPVWRAATQTARAYLRAGRSVRTTTGAVDKREADGGQVET